MNSKFRRRNFTLNLFEAWIALASVVSSTIYLLEPRSLRVSSPGAEVGYHLAIIWTVAYMLSGVFILYGLLRVSPRVEIAGLSLLAAATLINGIAAASVHGWNAAGSAVLFLTLGAASIRRAQVIWRSVKELSGDTH